MKWPRIRRPDDRTESRRDPAARRSPTVGVVVPAWGVEQWLPATLDSLLAQTHTAWQAVVVDDGSPDRSGEIAEAYAARDDRIRVLHTDNGGLGAARNRGTALVEGDYLSFVDSDDVLPPDALAHQVGLLEASGSDFVASCLLRVEAAPPAGAGAVVPRWMARLHADERTGIRVEEHPEILGDVFAHNKMFRRSFWETEQLAWPEGVRYEDQPTTTRAFLAGRFDVTGHVVYHWQVREDGSSITQQRGSLTDLHDRWATKRMSLTSVLEHGDAAVTRVFATRVLPGDLWVYLHAVPECDDAWWESLRAGIDEFWGPEGRTGHDLTGSILSPAMRLAAWLVTEDRRDDAAAFVTYVKGLAGRPVPRTPDGRALDVPADVLAPGSVPHARLLLAP
ncbi:glycosyltransferase family 2 protein [Nocardioides sp. Y6]|uniref:Glycosyltransferase family 2 protein n=1 Tax=Nocardioides malaquae TaxID=2773426 RepID=A0ABR9RV72_9ACTN|nr:glycosyltransferase family 2 protein [Nocardioides malaquae]MBE7325507.1 glycosyltransferase family 2 protein [Nocardioides malaquae]